MIFQMKINAGDFILYNEIILYVEYVTIGRQLKCLVIDGIKYKDTFAYGYSFMENIYLYFGDYKEISKITDLQEINRLQKLMVFK